MRVLHITDQMPGYISGGNLGILQFSYAWTRAAESVDYIGPVIEDDAIGKWYTNVACFDRPLTKIQKLKSMLLLQFSRNYVCWKNMDKSFDGYDLIYIDSTKMSYALKDVRKSGFSGRVVVRAHNVEADFFKVNYRENRSFPNFCKYIVAKPRERYMVKHADNVFAITNEDKTRLVELYGINADKITVCPVGVNRADKDCAADGSVCGKMRGLITGSMWFGPNAAATKWFIENVYPKVNEYCELTVAGFRPNDDLKLLCRKHGVTLIDSPKTVVPYFNEADLFIAPIFDGGGMKVKIAEAMAYGLPIITTPHGAIGYEAENGRDIYIAETADAFIAAIRRHYASDAREKALMRDRIRRLHADKYSLEAIEKLCKRYLTENQKSC